MTVKTLSPEIVSLIHHVELNKSGWWKKAVGQVIRGILWKAKVAITIVELDAALKKELGISLGEEALGQQLNTLMSHGSVSKLPNSSFKLSEAARGELTNAHMKAVAEQEQCHSEFIDLCHESCSTLDSAEIWDEFTKALIRAIHITGANLFHLLIDGNLEREVDWIASFLNKFQPVDREGVRKVLVAFFAPDNQACRNQVLRLMSAHFFAEASRLKPETIAAIEGDRKIKTIKVVLDTNFIFSVLGLHDNPGDDAALSLIDVAHKSGHHLEIKLYVLPSTIDEARRVLVNQVHMVERIRTTTAMARAALSQPLPSITKKFFDAASKSPGLTAANFFQPYIDDLRTILDGKGIKILDAQPAIYNMRQDVLDDVIDAQHYEKEELPEPRRKGYETLLHDVVLWHAVEDRRRADSESPFDVEYWAVSIDWRLIAFDRRKRSANKSKLPVVLHPSNLVQLVQFWLPRNQGLEDSLVDSLRLPLFFQSFDPEDEKATVKVLEAISRFENVGDLPEKTLRVVLANQALRGRIRDAEASNDKVFELVRDELLLEHSNTVGELDAVKGDLHRTEEILSVERLDREKSEARLGETSDQLRIAEERATTAEREAAAEAHKRHALEGEIQQKAVAYKIKLLRRHYALLFIILPISIGLLIVYFCYPPAIIILPRLAGGWQKWVFLLGLGVFPFALACVMSPFYCKRQTLLNEWYLPRLLAHIGKKGVIAPLTFITYAILQGGAWDWFRSIVGLNPP
jgi:hypothetical protein